LREQKAAEYPEDDRNLRCAEGLREMAAWLAEHPHPVNEWMARLDALDPEAYTGFQPDVRQQLARFRVHHGRAESVESFLEELATERRAHRT
jgi:hypothetical protein